jgi:hypothetical protein
MPYCVVLPSSERSFITVKLERPQVLLVSSFSQKSGASDYVQIIVLKNTFAYLKY